jgi:outer membrane protein
MKQVFFIAALMMTSLAGLQAQKIAVIDLDLILQSMPEYTKAQEELDKTATTWRQEIANEQDKIKSMYNKYQAEQVLMSEEMRKAKEEEIMNKEKEVRDMQREKFGPEGSLFKNVSNWCSPYRKKYSLRWMPTQRNAPTTSFWKKALQQVFCLSMKPSTKPRISCAA